MLDASFPRPDLTGWVHHRDPCRTRILLVPRRDGIFSAQSDGIAAHSTFAVLSIALFPLAEIIRVSLPGQPILLSSLPLLFLTAIWVFYLYGALPSCFLVSGISISILCTVGVAKALSANVPMMSIAMGLTSEFVWFPAAFVFCQIVRIERARCHLALALSIIVLLSLCFTLFHALAGREVWNLPTMHDAVMGRQYGDGYVRYYFGVFRSAPSYSSFLVFGSVPILSVWFSQDRQRYSSRTYTLILLGALSILPQAFLAGRRSKVFMLLAAMTGAYIASDRKTRRAIGVVLVLVCLLLCAALLSPLRVLRVERLSHVTSYSWRDFLERSFGVTPARADLNTMSVLGHGIGTAGYGALRSPNERHRALAHDVATQHPLMHYGWFQCIYAYGYIGLLLKLVAFGGIAVPLFKGMRQRSVAAGAAFWCFICCMYVYFFIQTSFLESVTSGVLFGITIGVGMGTPVHISEVRSRPRHWSISCL